MDNSVPKYIGLIGARKGSQRVVGKNIRPLGGHPLIAYAIQGGLQSGLFDRIFVSTDCPLTQKIAIYYGAEASFLRPQELATTTAIDVQWIRYSLDRLERKYDAFALLRATSPFRTAETIQRAVREFESHNDVDSIRAVELCHQHPGKMWVIRDGRLDPFLDQASMDIPWHARQYQDLPPVYVQNSSFEMAMTNVVYKYNSREGKVIAPFLTNGSEGFAIDYESDWVLAEHIARTNPTVLPPISIPPFRE